MARGHFNSVNCVVLGALTQGKVLPETRWDSALAIGVGVALAQVGGEAPLRKRHLRQDMGKSLAYSRDREQGRVAAAWRRGEAKESLRQHRSQSRDGASQAWLDLILV